MAFLANPNIQHALFISAGGGIGPRAFHMHRPEMQIDVVDIDAKVLETAKNYFFLEDDPKIRLFAKDGRLFGAGIRRTVTIAFCSTLLPLAAAFRFI